MQERFPRGSSVYTGVVCAQFPICGEAPFQGTGSLIYKNSPISAPHSCGTRRRIAPWAISAGARVGVNAPLYSNFPHTSLQVLNVRPTLLTASAVCMVRWAQKLRSCWRPTNRWRRIRFAGTASMNSWGGKMRFLLFYRAEFFFETWNMFTFFCHFWTMRWCS